MAQHRRRLASVRASLSPMAQAEQPPGSLAELLAMGRGEAAAAQEEQRMANPSGVGVPFFHHAAANSVYAALQPALHDTAAQKLQLEAQGFVVLKGLASAEYIARCRAAFEPRLSEYLAAKGGGKRGNRGPYRHYIDLPMRAPFTELLASEPLAALLVAVLGDDARCDMLASDTPLGLGSTYQSVHGDLGTHDGGPTRCLGVNWPLCAIDERNGPFEMAVGGRTHRMPETEARRVVEGGGAVLQRLLMDEGDVLVRDPRCVHRASPNVTVTPRPMLVYRLTNEDDRPPRHGAQSLDEYESMPPHQQRLLRSVPRVADLADVVAGGTTPPYNENGFALR